jgi:hypothetical protein
MAGYYPEEQWRQQALGPGGGANLMAAPEAPALSNYHQAPRGLHGAVSSPYDFDYSWHQRGREREAESAHRARQGAIGGCYWASRSPAIKTAMRAGS